MMMKTSSAFSMPICRPNDAEPSVKNAGWLQVRPLRFSSTPSPPSAPKMKPPLTRCGTISTARARWIMAAAWAKAGSLRRLSTV